ncbi:DUF1232 domain-containing protein [Mycoplasmatota bacterium]|nr:DUF1232 domain-containing protein [Mycoplasmatota bacterium]
MLNNEYELGTLLKAVDKMVSNKDAFKELMETIKSFISLVKDYSKGDYCEIPVIKVVLIVASLIYALSPFDIIPDTIPVIGRLDDSAILTYVYKTVKNDLEEYRMWKEKVSIAA